MVTAFRGLSIEVNGRTVGTFGIVRYILRVSAVQGCLLSGVPLHQVEGEVWYNFLSILCRPNHVLLAVHMIWIFVIQGSPTLNCLLVYYTMYAVFEVVLENTIIALCSHTLQMLGWQGKGRP